MAFSRVWSKASRTTVRVARATDPRSRSPPRYEKGTHTVKQIAEVVGVSCATVHRALSAS